MEQFTAGEILRLMEAASRLGVSVAVSEEGKYFVKIDAVGTPSANAAPAPVLHLAENAEEGEAAPVPPALSKGTVIKSPIVGTFYASPAPDKPAFAEPGKVVKKGDVLFIIESMKLMNEVQSERDGVVREVLASSGQAVEYGQPILILE